MKESNKIQEKNMNVLKGKKGRDGKCFDDNNLTIKDTWIEVLLKDSLEIFNMD